MYLNLKYRSSVEHHASKNLLGVKSVLWQNSFFSVDGLSSPSNISPMCKTLSRQLQNQGILLPRPLPLYGFRPTDLPRKSQGHRSLPEISKEKAIPHGHQGTSVPKHFGQCQQESRLAHIRRPCSSSYPACSQTLPKRRFRSRTGQHSICTGCHHHRSV